MEVTGGGGCDGRSRSGEVGGFGRQEMELEVGVAMVVANIYR